MTAFGRRPVPEQPRQSPASCSYQRMCDARAQFLSVWFGWLASDPLPGDVELELGGTQSALAQIAETVGSER